MALSEKALLVTLNISQWTARRQDKRASADVEATNRAATGVASVNKKLLPSASVLDKVHKLSAAIRTEYYNRTLPWAEGVGIIRADAYLPFCEAMGKLKFKWQQAVGEFADVYPTLRDESEFLLGDLYNESDYPDPSVIRRKFRLDLAFLPVPESKDWRVDVGAEEAEELRRQLVENIKESEGRAMQAAWDRVYKVVEKAHERLSNPDNIFRNSLIENAQELCAILPSLNITNDINLEQMRQRIERSLAKQDPDVLREDEGVREEVSDELAAIMSKMRGFYGA